MQYNFCSGSFAVSEVRDRFLFQDSKQHWKYSNPRTNPVLWLRKIVITEQFSISLISVCPAIIFVVAGHTNAESNVELWRKRKRIANEFSKEHQKWGELVLARWILPDCCWSVCKQRCLDWNLARFRMNVDQPVGEIWSWQQLCVQAV